MRGSPLIDRMRPNVDDNRFEFGVPQLKWFVTLNASRRSSTFCVLESGTTLVSARSIFQNAGPVRLLRTKLPNVPESGCANAARFKRSEERRVGKECRARRS